MQSCHFCGNKNLKNVETEYIYKHDGKFLFVENVPATQCTFCGEKYFEAKILKQIEKEFFSIYNGEKKVHKEIIVPTETFTEMAYA